MSKTAEPTPLPGADQRKAPFGGGGSTETTLLPTGNVDVSVDADSTSPLRVAPDEPTRPTRTDERDPIVQISNGIVALHKRYRGRGPSKVRVHWDGDLVTVLLRGSLSTVEKVLADEGHWTAVAEQRHAYEKVIAPEIIAIVQSATGRAVEAFMHAGNHDPDVYVETFVLAPA